MQFNFLSPAKLTKWFKKLTFILANYESDVSQAHARIKTLERNLTALHARANHLDKLVKDRTDLAVDVNFNEPNYVIVIGRYQKVDYIQTYSLGNTDFSQLVDHLKGMRKHGQIRRVDAPPQFRAVFERSVRDF